ncbi:deoxyhypusine hydroxylase-like [Gigantopelta aegis]|uniref:deoxyhypusine hydroxylase-like n=1 Tax=Gigantopelta aegis TaxID=1735272 RepID=UPI001B88998D|nr:deoxyhypusine hydroxylase-like [Gigantopelta aegis]
MSLDDKASVISVGQILEDKSKPLTERFRALFTLRNVGGRLAIDSISRCFDDQSALLKHELAYCLGQMQDTNAIPVLVNILKDDTQETMVRHEAGEALGAIGSVEVLSLLKEYSSDPVIEVAETCQLAVKRIEWLNNPEKESCLSQNPYKSVDPAPASVDMGVLQLKALLLDESQPLFERYRAMFSLRNTATSESVQALAEGLKCKSALFRHEVAYVLGQIQSDVCVKQLSENLCDRNENPMVRHECAEALGAIATPECIDILKDYLKDPERVVKESCLVALDMSEYENNDQLQYADSLVKINNDANAANLVTIK